MRCLLFSLAILLLVPTAALAAERYEVRILVKQDRRDLYYSQGIGKAGQSIALPVVLPANGQCKVAIDIPTNAVPTDDETPPADLSFTLSSIVPLTDGASQYREVVLANTVFRYKKGVEVHALETAEYSIVVELKRLDTK